ncbi:MAG: alpha/beta fold hydrolase [Planctomycetes bacterium]|nr:alpha/beta fold hydrolase [Planctomycetota bacterium]
MSHRDSSPTTFRIELDGEGHIVGDHAEGDRPGYMFLHGLGSVRQSEKSDSLLQHAGRRGVAFTRCDFRGHGESTGTIGQVTIGELIDDTVRLLDRFGPTVIVGSSLGGLVGAFATARRPDLVAGLGLIAPAFGFVSRLERAIDADGQLWTSNGRAFPLARRVLDDARQLDERGLPGRISVPTLIVHGDADEVVSHSHSRRFFDAVAAERKRLWIVPGGDHRLSEVRQSMWQRLDELLGNS